MRKKHAPSARDVTWLVYVIYLGQHAALTAMPLPKKLIGNKSDNQYSEPKIEKIKPTYEWNLSVFHTMLMIFIDPDEIDPDKKFFNNAKNIFMFNQVKILATTLFKNGYLKTSSKNTLINFLQLAKKELVLDATNKLKEIEGDKCKYFAEHLTKIYAYTIAKQAHAGTAENIYGLGYYEDRTRLLPAERLNPTSLKTIILINLFGPPRGFSLSAQLRNIDKLENTLALSNFLLTFYKTIDAPEILKKLSSVSTKKGKTSALNQIEENIRNCDKRILYLKITLRCVLLLAFATLSDAAIKNLFDEKVPYLYEMCIAFITAMFLINRPPSESIDPLSNTKQRANFFIIPAEQRSSTHHAKKIITAIKSVLKSTSDNIKQQAVDHLLSEFKPETQPFIPQTTLAIAANLQPVSPQKINTSCEVAMEDTKKTTGHTKEKHRKGSQSNSQQTENISKPEPRTDSTNVLTWEHGEITYTYNNQSLRQLVFSSLEVNTVHAVYPIYNPRTQLIQFYAAIAEGEMPHELAPFFLKGQIAPGKNAQGFKYLSNGVWELKKLGSNGDKRYLGKPINTTKTNSTTTPGKAAVKIANNKTLILFDPTPVRHKKANKEARSNTRKKQF